MEWGRSLGRLACLVLFASLFLGVVPESRAQLVLVTFDHPFQAQRLAGVALDPSGKSVMGLLIEDCDSKFKKVRASTWTDENGHFAFRRSRVGAVHFLRVSMNGFDPMEITVELKPSGAVELSIQLVIAT